LPDAIRAQRTQVARQVAHWRAAAAAMRDFDAFAPAGAWRELEAYLEATIRTELTGAIDRLERDGDVLVARLRAARRLEELASLRADVVRYRANVGRAEQLLEFFGDAVRSRSTPKLAAMLRGLDALAGTAMDAVLRPLGRRTPPVLTYLDRGLGASILRAGVRLWDLESINPVAAIKITRHNLRRPTALIHEAGHQVAAMLGFNEELARMLEAAMGPAGPEVAAIWASWSSEIAADAHAFVHTGYAAVAGLHDVVSGDPRTFFDLRLGDPHPVPYLRVLLGVAMCRRFYGAGPWDDLADAWQASYRLDAAPSPSRALIGRSLPLIDRVVETTLRTPAGAFGRRALAELVDPARVAPAELAALARAAGAALQTSSHWLGTEALRMLALSGYRAATEPERSVEVAEQYEAWMLRLGGGLRAVA
jgi:hypothetical protein